MELFFSYSHNDENLRNELEKHLSLLRRQGVIDLWSDHRIGPGEDISHGIDQRLESADIILLLISPDFLDSDYCYEVEMKRAMERHERGEARVIPIILRPCDWHTAPFGGLKALPADGKPVTKHQTLDDAFLDITRAIREVVQQLRPNSPEPGHVGSTPFGGPPASSATRQVRSSNLRIRQGFSDRQRQQFLDEAFEYIAQYFEGSLAELENRNPEVETRFKRVDAIRFEATAYVNGQERSRCGIWLGNRASIVDGILYSSSGLGNGNSFNESLSVADDDYSLYLKPIGMAMHGREL